MIIAKNNAAEREQKENRRHMMDVIKNVCRHEGRIKGDPTSTRQTGILAP